MLGIILLAGLVVAYIFYNKIYGPNIKADSPAKQYLYIPTNSSYEDLLANLEKNELVRSVPDFEWSARALHFGKSIRAGRYKLKDGMSNKQLIRKIQLGEQSPVDVILHSLRLKENLAGYVSRKLEADSLSIHSAR